MGESVISELPERYLYLLDLNVSYFEVNAEDKNTPVKSTYIRDFLALIDEVKEG